MKIQLQILQINNKMVDLV